MSQTFVNINNSESYTEPLPFQHFVGDYSSMSNPTNIPSATTPSQCDIECRNNASCEVWKFENFNSDLTIAGATLNNPTAICMTRLRGNGYDYADGELVHEDILICDTNNNVIRKLIKPKSDSVLSYYSIQTLRTPLLNKPTGIYCHRTNDKNNIIEYLYVCDTDNHVVRKIHFNGVDETIIAGTFGVSGYTGDHGPATSATLNKPTGIVCSDYFAYFYVCDSLNNAIRKIDRIHNNILTFIGDQRFFDYDFPDVGVSYIYSLNSPISIAIHEYEPYAYLYVLQNNSILKFSIHDSTSTSNPIFLSGINSSSMDIDNLGYVYINNINTNEVIKYDSTGQIIYSIGGFSNIKGICLDLNIEDNLSLIHI